MAISDEWWNAWWKADYSWEGLAQKPWQGWYVDKAWVEGEPFVPVPADERVEGVDYRVATLQDYWRRAGCSNDLYESPDGKHYFTPMHLPPRWRDGTVTWKRDPKKPPKAYDTLLQRELTRPIQKTNFDDVRHWEWVDHRMQWQGTVLADFNLNSVSELHRAEDGRIAVSVLAEMIACTGDANFNSATFCGQVDFNHAAFSGTALFRDTKFVEDVSFNFAFFAEKADFTCSEIFEKLSCRKAIFSRSASFYLTQINGVADFNEVNFIGDIIFWGANFNRGVDFSESLFFDKVTFKDASLVNASFRNVAFRKEATFWFAEFLGDVFFNSSVFDASANFTDAEFNNKISFSNVSFIGNADFKNIAVSGNADFRSAAFSGYADFISAAFSGDAAFRSAAFSGYADFISAAFSDHAFFRSATFQSDAIFSGQASSLLSDPVEAEIQFSSPETGEGMSGTYKQPEQSGWRAQRSFPRAYFQDATFFLDARCSTIAIFIARW